jgi:nucleoside-diphosphate-sugar epimerase
MSYFLVVARRRHQRYCGELSVSSYPKKSHPFREKITMKVLVIGGSGYVASLILPHLKASHELRIFDMKPPADESLEYFEGDINDLAAVTKAMEGVDAFQYMAMGKMGQKSPEERARFIATSFDANVKGLYHTARAAHEVGVGHGVYASSLSVYRNSGGWRNPDMRYFAHENMVPDALDCYGLTKRLGEEVCRSAVLQWGLTVNALRLCRPVSEEEYQEKSRIERPTIITATPDVARAFDAALRIRPVGFEAFFISGDYDQKLMSLAKAKEVLGWEPQARPTKSVEDDPPRGHWFARQI